MSIVVSLSNKQQATSMSTTTEFTAAYLDKALDGVFDRPIFQLLRKCHQDQRGEVSIDFPIIIKHKLDSKVCYNLIPVSIMNTDEDDMVHVNAAEDFWAVDVPVEKLKEGVIKALMDMKARVPLLQQSFVDLEVFYAADVYADHSDELEFTNLPTEDMQAFKDRYPERMPHVHSDANFLTHMIQDDPFKGVSFIA